jgi:hypothetical protein
MQYKNFGGAIANDTFVKLLLISGFIALTDSFYLGDVAANEVDSLIFLVTAPPRDTVRSYTVFIGSSNASSSAE